MDEIENKRTKVTSRELKTLLSAISILKKHQGLLLEKYSDQYIAESFESFEDFKAHLIDYHNF